ncbi:hypothetical protein [Paraburkholderia acidisoli]|uniref:Uncharacterized protein n=1 Tax=Paraburkholderia acidisoli TaxID=2571748 RepID=A0A7Z2GQT0_9BURK|nr:hypothetical protein [Paraburkholderia acidisoli]QGZ66268.1 hypothetical protein FAZ98_31195 [Paraburkholderia acidisoli]QGZ66355.1 hypothetical protein FAZ98_31685 [Paraburkholderia acidisoli]
MSISTVSQSAFSFAYDLAFQISPIILNGGIVANSLGGMMPIIGLTGQLAALAQGVLSGNNEPFARFVPAPGSTLVANTVATYPFANQFVAANAVIKQPKNISLVMYAPVQDTGGYLTKLAIFEALRSSIESHVAAGGTFHIATPAHIYLNCLLNNITDVTSGEMGKQQMVQFQWDFFQPLVSLSDTQSAQNSLMSKLSGGQQISPSGLAGTSIWSSAATAIGSAAQGAAQGINGITAAVNNFVAQ